MLLNVLLVVGIGLIVLFFRGVVNYMTWIFVAGVVLVFGITWYFLHRMREEKKTLKEMLALPEFQGRSVEVSLLGGFAAVKVGDRKKGETPLIEDPDAISVRDLAELGRMADRGLISPEEFDLAKSQIFRNAPTGPALPDLSDSTPSIGSPPSDHVEILDISKENR